MTNQTREPISDNIRYNTAFVIGCCRATVESVENLKELQSKRAKGQIRFNDGGMEEVMLDPSDPAFKTGMIPFNNATKCSIVNSLKRLIIAEKELSEGRLAFNKMQSYYMVEFKDKCKEVGFDFDALLQEAQEAATAQQQEQ